MSLSSFPFLSSLFSCRSLSNSECQKEGGGERGTGERRGWVIQDPWQIDISYRHYVLYTDTQTHRDTHNTYTHTHPKTRTHTHRSKRPLRQDGQRVAVAKRVVAGGRPKGIGEALAHYQGVPPHRYHPSFFPPPPPFLSSFRAILPSFLRCSLFLPSLLPLFILSSRSSFLSSV